MGGLLLVHSPFLYEVSEAKTKHESQQIESLEKNITITEMLFKMGKTSSYLEVITAQQSLLQAQLAQLRDRFSKMRPLHGLQNDKLCLSFCLTLQHAVIARR